MKYILILLFAFSLQAQSIKWAQIGDTHNPILGSTNAYNTLATYLETNGVKVLLSCGDVYEQNQFNWSVNPSGYGITMDFYTNWLQTLVNSNIMVVQCPGNHDCDNTNSSQFWPIVAVGVQCASVVTSNLWNSWFPLSFYQKQVGFITNMTANDSRNIIMAWTNGTDNFMFCTYAWTASTNLDLQVCYSNQTFWASSVANQYQDHNFITMSHYMISGHAMMETNSWSVPAYFDIGPSWELFVDGFQNAPNFMAAISGHTTTLISGHCTTNCLDGHPVDVSCLDLQQANWVLNDPSNAPEDVVRLFTPDSKAKVMHAQTYVISLGRFLTNFDTYIAQDMTLPGMVANSSQHAGTYNRFIYDWYFKYAVPRQYYITFP